MRWQARPSTVRSCTAGRWVCPCTSVSMPKRRNDSSTVAGGLLRHFPQPVVRVEVAVVVAQLAQPRAQHREMPRLVRRHAYPVRVVVAGHSPEPVHRVPGQVDRVELDVCDRVDEGRAARVGTEAPAWQVARMDQPRLRGAAGHGDGSGWRRVGGRRQSATCEGFGRCERARELVVDARGVEASTRAIEQRRARLDSRLRGNDVGHEARRLFFASSERSWRRRSK